MRAAFPGYTGARPRMQLWHGTADEVLRYVNFGEEIKQWTNVLGVSQTPTSTDTPQSGWTGTRWTGGFTAAVRVTAGSAAITGWRVTMDLPGGTSIVNLWNGSPSGTTGSVW